jgi:outer membrane cobalamin receptor
VRERGRGDTEAAPPGQADTIQSFRDWEGSWDLVYEFQGKSYSQVMTLKPTQTALFGDYVLGILEGQFVQGDFSKVTGDITNTTNTGGTCRSGKQAGKQGGSFSLTLAKDGRSLAGWWDVCGEGQRWLWKAVKRAGTPGGRVDDVQSFRNWEGSWNLVYEYQGKSYSQVMTLKPTQTTLFGDYVVGILEGQFVQGDFSKVAGDITNTTNTGSTCRSGKHSGKQGGSFSLTLARDGRSIYGWWDVCGEGQKWSWKADKR